MTKPCLIGDICVKKIIVALHLNIPHNSLELLTFIAQNIQFFPKWIVTSLISQNYPSRQVQVIHGRIVLFHSFVCITMKIRAFKCKALRWLSWQNVRLITCESWFRHMVMLCWIETSLGSQNYPPMQPQVIHIGIRLSKSFFCTHQTIFLQTIMASML